ncbi:MAG: tandem-95 repeat protein [Rhodospirillales bacterium]|nr:tandem-95 repeat protein [Rhodospirillales bacterium]
MTETILARSDQIPASNALSDSAPAGIRIPEDFPLFASAFIRSGDDLRAVAPNGFEFVVGGYFRSDRLLDLQDAKDGHMAGNLVASLATQNNLPNTSNIAADLGRNYSGFVESVEGNATIIRASGDVEQIKNLVQLLKGDFLSVDEGSSVNIALTDGSRLSISDRGHILFKQITPESFAGRGHIVIEAAGGRFYLGGRAPGEPPAASIVIETPDALIHAHAALTFQHTAEAGLIAWLNDDAQVEPDALVVVNDAGQAVVTHSHQVITVTGPDDAPVISDSASDGIDVQAIVGPTAAGGGSDLSVEALSVSPGGDLDALSGEQVVTTGSVTFYDLSPEATPLASPSSGIFQDSASAPTQPLHHTQELLLNTQTTQGTPSSPGPEPKILQGWEPLKLPWEVLGEASISYGLPEASTQFPLRGIRPTERDQMVRIEGITPGIGDIDSFLHLDPLTIDGAVPGAEPAGASAIRASLRLVAGDTISFDWFFDAANETERLDYAMFTIDGANSLGRAFKLADSSTTGIGGATGWRSFVFTVTQTDTYTLGFAAVNDRTTDDASRLLIDNVLVNRAFGNDYVVIEGVAGQWQSLAQKPTVVDDHFATRADQPLEFTAQTLLANDVDPDPFDAMGIASIDTSGLRGIVSFSITGAIIYDPDGDPDHVAASQFAYLALGETADTSFRYTVNAGNGVTADGTVRITVTGVNDAPTAVDDKYRMAADAPATSLNVLANDDDVDSDDSAATLHIIAAHAATGTVAFSGLPGAGLTYSPGTNFQTLGAGETAVDVITYTVADRHDAESSATVKVTVTGVNDAPHSADDIASTDEDIAIAIAPLANDVDPDAHDRLAIAAIIVNGLAQPIAAGEAVTLASGAVVTLQADGRLNYDPAGRFNALASGATAVDTIRYRVTDGHGGESEAEVHLTITGRNDAPLAGDDFVATSATARLIIPVAELLANDSDPDRGDALRLIGVDGTGALGSVSLQGASILYDPQTDATGRFVGLSEGETAQDTFHYILADGVIDSSDRLAAIGTVTVTVTGVNDPVDAIDDTFTTSEDAPIEAGAPGVLANDRDPDLHDTHTVIAVDGQAANVSSQMQLASGAFVTISASGRLTYNAGTLWNSLGAGEQRQEIVTYQVSDGHGSADTAQVTITILGSNDTPTAIADVAPADEDSQRRIAVLANDSDPDTTDKLSVRSVILKAPDGTPTLGTVRINPDFTLTYDPEGNFDHLQPGETATDSFQYVIDDGHGGRSTSSVTVTIHGVDNPQPAAHQELLDSFDVPLTAPTPVAGLTAQFGLLGTGALSSTFVPHDELGHSLASLHSTHLAQMAVFQGQGASAAAIEAYLSNDVIFGGQPLVRLPSDSDLTSAKTGSATRTHLALTANDVVDSHILLSFDWNFVANAAERLAGTSNDFAVLTVTDGTTTRVYKLSDARATSWGESGWRTSVLDVTHDFALGSDGALRLTVGFAVLNDATPDNPSTLLLDNIRLNRPLSADFELVAGSSDGAFFTYRQAPTALPDTAVTSENTAIDLLTTSLTANDFSARGIDPATLAVIGLDSTGTQAAVTFSGDHVTYDPNGRFDYLAEGQSGSDTFRYLLTDGNGGIDQGEVTITVNGLNDAPLAVMDTGAAREDGPSLTIDVLANDDDVDSDDDRSTLRVVAANAASGAAVAFAGIAGAGIVYRPSTTSAFQSLGEGETATDTITYTIEDRHGAHGTGLVQVTITGVNDAPVAAADAASTDEDTAITLKVLANDTDPDAHDTLSVSAIGNTTVAVGSRVVLASGASVTLNADGGLRYDPNTAFASLARGQSSSDSFVYEASDGHGGKSSAQVSVQITGLNDAPIAGADAMSSAADTKLTVVASALLANDRDPDSGDTIHVSGIDGTGTLGIVGFDGTNITYDPGGHFRSLGVGETATDTFHYQIADHDNAIGIGTVTVTLVGVNDAPTATDDSGATDEDTPTILDVLANDSDPDVHDTITITSIDTTGTHGLVSLNADGTITFDPRGHFDSLNPGETGHDSFSYRVSDGHGGFDEATVSVSIAGRPDNERIVDSFEAPFSATARSSSFVTTATQYQETDGVHGIYTPTDGVSMAKLEANGTSVATLQSFLSQPAGSLFRDPVDGSSPANGAAFKLAVVVQAGDRISFDWMFDARDFVNAPSDGKADNDYAVLSVAGDGAPTLFKLSDVRETGDQGATGWRSSIYEVSNSGTLTIGLAVVNDRVAGPSAENSILLVDNLRVNHPFGTGYQVVDSQADGHFETLVLT